MNAEQPCPSAGPDGLILHTEGFISTLKTVVGHLQRKYPQDAQAARFCKRVMLAADVNPTALIEGVGAHLYEYRSQIYSGDSVFFLTNDFQMELGQAEAANAKLAATVITMVKRAWHESSPEDQANYIESVQSLLDDYIEYISICLDA